MNNLKLTTLSYRAYAENGEFKVVLTPILTNRSQIAKINWHLYSVQLFDSSSKESELSYYDCDMQKKMKEIKDEMYYDFDKALEAYNFQCDNARKLAGYSKKEIKELENLLN